VHIGSADLESAKSLLYPKVTRQIAAQVMKDTHIADLSKFPDTLTIAPMVLLPVKDSHVLGLGERDIQVMALPVHTPGSICLFDNKLAKINQIPTKLDQDS
jgi:glyoxylase-like metal-dependent hydrolase (beta-lactamase superfamily II)